MNQSHNAPIHLTLPAILLATLLFTASHLPAAQAYTPFDAPKTAWHGFDRFDFLLDEQTLAIKPLPAGDNANRAALKGQRRCIIVAPKENAPGNPWSWRGCYWDHQPQAEIDLLKRGFHIAYITASPELRPDAKWDAWYAFLTEKHGLSPKPAFIGMSRGGEFEYTWAVRNPDKVSCIYADNPGANPEVFMKLIELAKKDVPLLHVCGSIDPLLGRNSLAIEAMYQQFGGRISMMIKEGAGHHPHSLRDPKPIVDFIVAGVNASSAVPPAFAGQKFTRTSYYSKENDYRNFPAEGMFITRRGPFFSPTYNRYVFDLPGVEGVITVIQPQAAAAGMPWVYRADFVDRDASVDLALLAKGFHIVTGPVPYNADGPHQEHWDAVYSHLVENGFSKKVVMEGSGGAAGQAFAWATANPDKIACIYAQNPVLHSYMSKAQPLDTLAPLAKAGVPLLAISGENDPALNDNTRVLEKRYKELGGKITVILQEGQGHSAIGPKETKTTVDFILEQAASPSSRPLHLLFTVPPERPQ